MASVKIIRCGSIFFFTTSMPTVRKLSLVRSYPKCKATVHDAGDCFAVAIEASGGKVIVEDMVRNTIEYTWNELHKRGIVSSDKMPTWIDGNIKDMLPKRSESAAAARASQAAFSRWG